jgi:uncharacterized membrane protein
MLQIRKNRVFSKSQKSVNYFWSDMKDAKIISEIRLVPESLAAGTGAFTVPAPPQPAASIWGV